MNSKTLTAAVKSPKTTALGALSLLIAAAMAFQEYLGTGTIDVAKYLTPENIAIVIAVITGLIGLVSSDADKSSQDSGIRAQPEQPVDTVAPTTRDMINDQFDGNLG